MATLKTKRAKAVSQEFTDTRAFLRQCMAAVVTGGLTHTQAQDIALLAQQQNYSVVIENAIIPLSTNKIEPKSLIHAAKELANVTDIEIDND